MAQKIKIHTEFIKLDSFMKFAGIAETGGHAKELILNNEVLVNGEVCVQRGKKLYNKDKISINNQEFEVMSTCI